MKLFRVLHLSDIHIGDTYMESKNIAYRIISDIEDENLANIQCVVVTGDIFEGRCGLRPGIVDEAVDFFNTLFNELKNTSSLEKTDFLFVPGNHDIMRLEDKSQRWKKYYSFLKGFYGSIPDFYDLNDFSLLKVYSDSRMAFVGFNSCGLKDEPLFDATLVHNFERIDEAQFSSLSISKEELVDFIKKQAKEKTFVDFGEITPQQILKVRRDLNKYDDYNIVAFFHHHFYLFPEVYNKFGDSSLIRNYTNIIHQLQQAHVKTVLHGHKHFDLERPLITDSYYENAKNVINIIAGGSVGTGRTEKHTFNVIDFYDHDSDVELVQRKFVYNNDQLEPITTRQIPPRVGDGSSNVKLIELLKFNNPDLYSVYTETIDKINIAADDYNNMLKWLENIFVGFDEIHKKFESDSLCVFFLLYAMNYRVLKIKQSLGKERIDESYYIVLNKILTDYIGDVGFNKTQYLKIFEQSDLNELKESADSIFDIVRNKKAKAYLAFSMVSIFVTDIYLMLRYYAGSFYNRYIKYKVNIKLDETEFHQNVPVQKIMIHSDADRRSAFIDLKCNSATAHKLAVLFVKEFELIISKYEDYFKTVGLKLYYITPKIEKNNMPNAIDNYNFEAYIPTLIPLLTGDNIYARKEVFARELIQNSIDAIAVRATKDHDFDKTIYITLGQLQDRKFFRIKDYGTGMDRFKIERYFTSIGRSFYSGDEYRDLEISYKPISNFGIGFLSAFMICREIDVKTRYYLDEKEGIKLHIPNFDGCFFIEKDDELDVGTEITLYIDKVISHDIQFETIIDYICKTMKDIDYDINIKNQITKEERLIESKNVRKHLHSNDVLFVPFLDSGEVVESISLDQIRTGEFIDKYPYGLLIDVTGSYYQGGILNSGIRLNDTDVDDVWRLLLSADTRNIRYFERYFLFNFPSNYLNIDVSREKIASFTNVLFPDFSVKLIGEIIKQINDYQKLAQTFGIKNAALNLHTLMMFLVHLCKQNEVLSNYVRSLMSSRYVLYFRFNSTTIELIVGKQGKRPSDAIAYSQSNSSKLDKAFVDFMEANMSKSESEMATAETDFLQRVLPAIHDMTGIRRRLIDREFDDYYYYYTYGHSARCDFRSEVLEYLQKALKIREDTMVYAFLLLTSFLLKKDPTRKQIAVMDNVLIMLLEQYSVSDVERGRSVATVEYEDIRKVIKRLKKTN